MLWVRCWRTSSQWIQRSAPVKRWGPSQRQLNSGDFRRCYAATSILQSTCCMAPFPLLSLWKVRACNSYQLLGFPHNSALLAVLEVAGCVLAIDECRFAVGPANKRRQRYCSRLQYPLPQNSMHCSLISITSWKSTAVHLETKFVWSECLNWSTLATRATLGSIDRQGMTGT